MRLVIQCDPVSCLAAGIEPADSIEIDVGALSPEDRAAIAGIMDGVRVTRTLPTPTLDSLLAVARAAKAAADEEAAKEAAQKAEKAAKIEADRAALTTILRDKPTKERVRRETHRPEGGPLVEYEYSEIMPDIPHDLDVWDQPSELKKQFLAWRSDCEEETKRRRDAAREAAIAAAAAARREAAEKRATMSIDEIVASLPQELRKEVNGKWERIVTNTGDQLVLARKTKNPKLTRYAKINFCSGTVEKGVAFGDDDELLPTAAYPLRDGVLTIEGSTWAAIVADPTAVRPRYDFLARAPGGYEAPNFNVGDILVWGARDKKGRKKGPYDRLVYLVKPDEVHTIRTDYADARRLRRLLLD